LPAAFEIFEASVQNRTDTRDKLWLASLNAPRGVFSCGVERSRELNVVPYRLAAERRILQLISLGASLCGILDTLCTAIDVQLGNVVSRISLSEQEHDPHPVASRAGGFGLSILWSEAILSETDDLLGTLEVYCCDRRSPTANEFRIIERAVYLAAVAIQSQPGPGNVGIFSRRNPLHVYQ
jgi:hypothetical protein